MNLKEHKKWVTDFVSAVEARHVAKALSMLMDALNNNDKDMARLAQAVSDRQCVYPFGEGDV